MFKAKLFNWLFGWDYVAHSYQYGFSTEHKVSRVYLDGDGKPFFFREKAAQFLTYEDKETFAFITFSPSKYFAQEVLKDLELQQ